MSGLSFVIPGRAHLRAGPESILRSAGVMDSGLAASPRPGMTQGCKVVLNDAAGGDRREPTST
jgi:hypothetical protein